MENSPFTQEDIEFAASRGITEKDLLEQLEIFRRGTPYVRLLRPCTVGDGIIQLGKEEEAELLDLCEDAAAQGRLMKFVPASGAATRMFKNLAWYCNHAHNMDLPSLKERLNEDEKIQAIWEVIQNIRRFAFFEDLEKAMARDGIDIEKTLESGDFRTLFVYLLTEKGLNYSNLPKALLKFHRYKDHQRTALEEHLVETLNYSCNKSGSCAIHFTVSPNHRSIFEKAIRDFKKTYDSANGVLDVTLSEQSPSTDTIAVDMNNEPLRNSDGTLVFRPGGHGSLLKNLNELNGDIIFLKNVDNVVPDKNKPPTYHYKKLLTGYLLKLQKQVFEYLEILENDSVPGDKLQEIKEFCQVKLNIDVEEVNSASNAEKADVLRELLNRPLRVCGMIENRGEAGGGPFWVMDYDGNVSIQIVEISQIDKNSPTQMIILECATHFNPVFIACGLKDYRGKPFDLFKFRDHRAVFITTKYMDGRELKALEWPGLWNGSMAYWNTVFVEVPAKVFNPVKTVNDLLKEAHC